MDSDSAISRWKEYNEYVSFTSAPSRIFGHHERATELQLCPGMKFEVLSSERDSYWIAQLMRFDDKQLTLKWETSPKGDSPSRTGATKAEPHEFVIERAANRVKRIGWAAANRVRPKVPHGVTIRGNLDSLIEDLLRSTRVSNIDLQQDGIGYSAIECLCNNLVLEYMYDPCDAKAVWFVKVVANLGGRLQLGFVTQLDTIFPDEPNLHTNGKSEEPGKSKVGRKPSPKKLKSEADDTKDSDLIWLYYTDFRLHPVGFVEQNSARQFRYVPPSHCRLNEENSTRIKTAITTRRNVVSPFDVLFSRRPVLARHGFTLNERIEALDNASPMHIRPARVSIVHDDYYFSVSFDAYETVSKRIEPVVDNTILCCAMTNTLFPVCFAKANALVLTTPRGFSHVRDSARENPREEAESSRPESSIDIDWFDYLRALSQTNLLNVFPAVSSGDEADHEVESSTSTSTVKRPRGRPKAVESAPPVDEPATRKYAHLNSTAVRVYPNLLKRGMKIECVNPRDPSELVLVTVQRVFDSLLWVAIDADPHLFLRQNVAAKHSNANEDREAESQCFFIRIDSTELFPVGFSERFIACANSQHGSDSAKKRVHFLFPFIPRSLASESHDSVRINVNAASCFVGQSLSAARLVAQPSLVGGDGESSVSDSVKQLFGVLMNSSVRPPNLLRMLKCAAAKKPKKNEAAAAAAAAATALSRFCNEKVQLRVEGQVYETESRVCQSRFALVDYLRHLCATLDSCPYLISPYRIGPSSSSGGRSKQAERDAAEFALERCPARCDCFFVSRQRLKRDTVQRRLAQLEQFGITKAQVNDTLSTIERYKMSEKRDDADAEQSDAEDAADRPNTNATQSGKKTDGKGAAKRSNATKAESKTGKKGQADSEVAEKSSALSPSTSASPKRKAGAVKAEAGSRKKPVVAKKSPATAGRKKPSRLRNGSNSIDASSDSENSDSQSSVSLNSELSNLDSDDEASSTPVETESSSDSSAVSESESSDKLQSPPAKRKRPDAKTKAPSVRSSQQNTPKKAAKTKDAKTARPSTATTNGHEASRADQSPGPGSGSKAAQRKRELAAASGNSNASSAGAVSKSNSKQTTSNEAGSTTAQSRFVPPMSPPIRVEPASSSTLSSVANAQAVAFVRRHVPANLNPIVWNVQELAEYLRSVPECGPVFARRIQDEQIDGRAFLLLTVPMICDLLKLPLGRALHLSVQVEKLKLVYLNCFA